MSGDSQDPYSWDYREAVSSDVYPPGTRFADRYVIRSVLGAGGAAVVYRATDETSDRDVALKVLRATKKETSRRFLREGEVTASLRHPGIVCVYSVGEAGGHRYAVYELVEGGVSLDRVVDELDPPQRVRLLHGVAEALAFVHGRGVVHRDVKLENILVDADGRPRLADFGLASAEATDATRHTRLTKEGQILGTPLYMAPELVLGRHGDVGPATDVWSFGVVLYRCLAGLFPFPGVTFPELMAQIVSQEPPPPRTVQRGISGDLEAITLRCLAKDPAKRYPDAAPLAADLARVLVGEALEARGGRWSARHTVALACAVALGLAILGGALANSGRVDPAPEHPTDERRVDARAEQALARRARDDPAGFLARLSALPADSPQRERLRPLAGDALRGSYLAAVRRASAPDGGEAERELASLAATAAALELDLDDLADAKARAVEETTPAWEAALRRRLSLSTETELLWRLAGVLRAPPAVPPGARLARALSAIQDELLDLHASGMQEQRHEAAFHALTQLLRNEEVLFYALGLVRPGLARLRPVLERQLAMHDAGWTPDVEALLVLTCFRVGTSASAASLSGKSDPESLARLLQRYPRSRALRFWRHQAETRGGPVPLGDWPRLLEALEDLLREGRDDLAPVYLGEAHLRAATVLTNTVGDLGAAEIGIAERAARIAEHARAARVLVGRTRAAPLFSAYSFEARSHALRADPEGALRLWEEALAAFETRTEGPPEGRADGRERHFLALCHRGRGEALARLGHSEQALAAVQRALAVHGETLWGNDLEIRGTLSALLRAAGRAEEAKQALLPGLSAGGHGQSRDFAIEALRLFAELGEGERVTEILRVARRAFPGAREFVEGELVPSGQR